MMSITVFSLLLVVTFAVCGLSYPTEEGKNVILSEKTFLEDKILNGIDSPTHLCDDPYTVLCGHDRAHSKPSYLKQSYSMIRNHLINILGNPVGQREVRALAIEKKLFQQCMTSGSKNDTQGTFATMNFVSDLFQQTLDIDAKWQEIDERLSLQGFGFTFYDIGVERDPEHPERNIITLQPPSYTHIENLRESIAIALDAKKFQQISKSIAWRFYDSINHDEVQKFFDQWLKAFLYSTTPRMQTEVKTAKMSLSEWNSVYYERSHHRPTSKIDWEEVVKKNFDRVGISVTGQENIMIKNKDYFFYLTAVLGRVPNDVIVNAIKTKVIVENIRLIDWKNAESLMHRKRSLFCFENTKLYGASFRLLRDLKKEDSRNAPNYVILKDMLDNIASVTESAIDESNNLSPKEKTYLRAQVKLITSDIINYNKYRPTVNSYYGNYELSPSYFVSIINYRKMLKEKELRTLEDHLVHLTEPIPFSLTDLEKPRNRFILNVFANSFLLSKQPIPAGLQREVHYGIYGVKIASFLYGLLNENRFEDGVIVRGGRVNWYDHPDYPAESLKCFAGDSLRPYGRSLATETVTQIFGAHIAYKAMLKDYHTSPVSRQKDYASGSSSSTVKIYSADQLFFMAYGKYHCDLSRNVLNTVLSNLNEYNYAFKCNLTHQKVQPQCSLEDFDIQKQSHFLNVPF